MSHWGGGSTSLCQEPMCETTSQCSMQEKSEVSDSQTYENLIVHTVLFKERIYREGDKARGGVRKV